MPPPLLINKTWTQRAAGEPVVHFPFACMAKAMEDDWWGNTVRNTVRNTAQISRVHRGDRCMHLCHLLLKLNGWVQETFLMLKVLEKQGEHH